MNLAADLPINSTARVLARDVITTHPSLIAVANRDRQPRNDEWEALCLVAAQLRAGDYIPLPLPIGVAIERLAPEIVAQHALVEQHESAYRLADLLCQMARVHRCPCCPHFLDGLHECKQAATQNLLTHVLQAGRVVCGAGQYHDLQDAQDSAVPADDLRAFEQALLALQTFQLAIQGQVPPEFEIPVLLRDTAGDPAQTVPARVRNDSQGVWIMVHNPAGQECAAVFVANHDGQIELKAWSLPNVEDDAAITAVLLDNVASITANTEGNHHDD